MKKLWIVKIEQNGGEYCGEMRFFAEKVETLTSDENWQYGVGKLGNVLVIDGVKISFDEGIESIKGIET